MALVDVRRQGPVVTITLDDVERRNVLSQDMLHELVDAMDAAEDDDGARVVVLTNAGGVFCAGADLAADHRASTTLGPADVFGRVLRSRKPYVGRIAGHAVAGGLGLAAATDISVVVDGAKFGFTEVRVGVAPAIISVVCLPKMRLADAGEAMLRGNRFGAAEAVRLGLVNRVVPAADLDAAVQEVVDDLLLGGPDALAATKSLRGLVLGRELDVALRDTAALSARLFASDEASEGMAAFRERRMPAWVMSED